MPSKGVQVYAYIAVPGCEVEFSVPRNTVVKRDLHVQSSDHLEVGQKNLGGPFKFTGRFSFKVSHNGAHITDQWVDINTMTGNQEDGTMQTMENTPSFVSNDIIVTYGFYDSGRGVAGLPNSDQCFVTVSPNYSNWMATLAPTGSPQADRPFHRFVLPAAHDIGMNSMQNCEALLQGAPSGVVRVMFGNVKAVETIVNAMAEGVVKSIAPNIIRALAITQKDTLSTILAIGARYFEFRPAHCHSAILPYSALPDTLYFQHGAITGMLYEQFLHEVIAFLVQHPSEIVVVQLRADGVPEGCKKPSDDELRDALNNALQQASGSINVGTWDDVQNLTVNDLRNQGKRLLLLHGVDQYSSYDDAANATLTGEPIVAAFEKLNTDEQNKHQLTVVQCQATATNIPDVIKYSVIASNVSTSPLLATKPICDMKTLSWLVEHGDDRLKGDRMVVVLNDFFDGATADICIGMSAKRLQ